MALGRSLGEQTQPLSWLQRGALQGWAAAVLSGLHPTLFAGSCLSRRSLDVPLIGCHVSSYSSGPNAAAGAGRGPRGASAAPVANASINSSCLRGAVLPLKVTPVVSRRPPSSSSRPIPAALEARGSLQAPSSNSQTQDQNKLCAPVLGITCVRPSGRAPVETWLCSSSTSRQTAAYTQSAHNNKHTRRTPCFHPAEESQGSITGNKLGLFCVCGLVKNALWLVLGM